MAAGGVVVFVGAMAHNPTVDCCCCCAFGGGEGGGGEVVMMVGILFLRCSIAYDLRRGAGGSDSCIPTEACFFCILGRVAVAVFRDNGLK